MDIQKRIQLKIQEIPESSDIELDWRKIKTIASQLGKCKEFTQRKEFKIWDGEIKLIIQQKNLAQKKNLKKKTIENETE